MHFCEVMKIQPSIVCLLLFALSCKKSDSGSVINITDMPIRVGDSWTYLASNYPPTETDTVTFTITGSEVPFVPGSTIYNTATTIAGVAIDSGLITKTATSITYAGHNGKLTFAGSDMFDGWIFSFPLRSGGSYSASGETIQVISTGQNVTIQGNSYINVSALTRTAITPGGPVTDTVLVAPRIGIIQWDGCPIISYKL